MNKIQKTSVTIVSLLMAVSTWADTEYTITINPATGSGSGTITANATTSIPGRTIILTSHPASGSFLSKLTVTPFEDGGGAQSRRANPTILSTIALTTNSDGTYSFIMPNCRVEVDAVFETASSISSATINLVESSRTYDWEPHLPVISNVKIGTTTLIEGTDYTVNEITSITNVGTRAVTIRGIGKYTGEKSTNYTITPRNITGATITLSSTVLTYTGSGQKPSVNSVHFGGHELNATNDYTVTNPDQTNANTTLTPTYTVTVNGQGNFTGSATTTYKIDPKPITSDMVTISPFTFTYNGNNLKPTSITVHDAYRNVNLIEDTDYVVTNNGGTNAGTYYVTIDGKTNSNYKDKVQIPYTITETGMSSITISPIADQTYTGAAITPNPTVKYGNNITLVKDTHYSLSYVNNTNVGQATVTVTLKGGYTGSSSINFKIVEKSLSGATVTPSPASFTYNGNVQKPTFSVVKDSRTLAEGVDYEVTYSGDAISAGTQNVTISGIGNYKDTQGGSYTINTLSLSDAVITLPAESYVYNREAQEPPPVVRVGNLVISSSDYTIRYGNDNITTNEADVTNVGTKTIYITGQTNCSDSKSKTYTITPMPLLPAMVSLAGEVTYTGSALTPAVTVNDGVGNLTQITDFTVTYDNNIKVGTATVTVKGLGNYSGIIQKTFHIQENVHGSFTVDDIDAVTYDGTAHQPTPNVKYGETDLTNDVDYTLSYTNHINAGTATVTVTGKGGYAGSSGSKNFTIQPKLLDADNVTLSFTNVTYTGNEIKPTVTVLDGETPLTKDLDFTVTYPADVISQGEKTVKITGIRNYTTATSTATTIDKIYTIGKVDISTASVTLESASYVYDKTEKKPSVLVVAFSNGQVVPSSGYDVAWSQNINATSATNTPTVTVTGKGNYEGTTTATFQINPKPVTSSMMTLNQENFTYTGSNQKPTVTVSDMNGASERITADDYDITNNGGTEVGNYEVKIVGKRNYTGEAEKQFSITAQGSTGFTIATVIGNQTYTGSPITPTVTVNKADTEIALTPGTDYDVAYSDNVNVGTATVTVTGKGNYASTKTTTFNITAKSLTADIVTLSTPTTFTYNGNIQKPTVTVSDGNAMKEADYVITNADHSDVGNYTITVTATDAGNYSGSVEKNYAINPLSISEASVSLEQNVYTYDGQAKRPAVSEVKVGTFVVPTSGSYTIRYDNDDDSTNEPDLINQGTKKVIITGTSNFTGEVTKNYTISPKAVTSDMILLSSGNLVYTGSPLKPEVTVNDGAKLLIEGETKDYTLVNAGAVNVGTYSVSITGHGNYGGQASKEYNIIAVGSSGFNIADIDAVMYDGTTKEPTVVVRDANTGDLLTKDTHYTVNYTNNKNAGTALANVTGIGNYQGTATKPFKINPKTLTEDMVQITGYTLTTGDGFIYNGAVQKPAVMVADGSAMTADDYVVVNNGGLNVNETSSPYEITITGSNNYTGVITKQFTIKPLSIETAKVVLYEMASYVYDGTAKNPGVREVAISSTIVPTSSYTVEISPNVNVGTVTVTVTGKENFTGTASTTFEITPKPITDNMVILSEEVFYYNGELQRPDVEVKDGENTLVEETDYTIVNEGGTEVGSYEVKVTGLGNYTSEVIKTYVIERSDFSVDITATDEEQKEFAVSLIVSLIDEENNNIRVKGVKIPESEKDKEIDLTIPANCTVDEVTYTITEIAAYAFEDAEHLQNLYLPDTEETLTIGDNAIPATTTIHTSLALLDDYALMPSLGANFRNDKVMTTVKAKNQYWTFSSGVDVYVPENITVFTVQERTTTTVAIVELTSTELNVSGASVIKSNNGVLLSGNSDTSYDIVACPRRMSSGTFISTDDHKDYGEENCLEPVIEATHYENDYYILKDNKFCSIKLEDEAVKVPAGKAVLHLPAVAKGRSYSTVLDVINEGTTSVSEEVKVNSEIFATADWYDLNGRKIEGRPVKKGVYIVNGKKVVIK